MTATPTNPLLADWTTPFEAPPFAAIEDRHFRPAIDAALAEPQGRDRGHRRQSRAGRPSPTRSRRWSSAARPCDKVSSVFFNLTGAHTNDALEAIERDVSPLFSRHRSEIYLERCPVPPRRRALRRARRARPHGRAGARPGALPHRLHAVGRRAPARPSRRAWPRSPSGWRRSARSSARTSWPTRRTGRCASMRRTISRGLPDFLVDAAAKAAADRGQAGKHLDHPVALLDRAVPAILAAPRSARDRLPRLAGARRDGRAATIAPSSREMVALRAERARLLGFASFAHYRLDDSMADDARSGRWICSPRCGRRPAPGRSESATPLQAIVAADGGNFDLAAWDWRYLRRAPAQGRVRSRRGRAQALSAARPPDRGRLRHREPPVRPQLRRARRHPDLSSRCPQLRGEGPRRGDDRPLPRRLFREALEAQRRLDERLPQPGEARRRHQADHRQRDELRQGGGRRSRPCSPSTMRGRCSTSSATGCTACCRTSPIR